jgi:DNA-binding transcriptional LysR family regulator
VSEGTSAQPAHVRIQLKQLRYFLAVAEELNFTRAAERIGIEQPPLSQQISNLERELNAVLFIRSHRSVKLTEAGEALILHARRLINGTDQAARIVGQIARGERGVLSIGAIFSAMYTVIPFALRMFSVHRPNVRIELAEMTITQQIQGLHEGRIDVGILRGPLFEPDLSIISLFSETFVAAIPTEHPLARAQIVSLEDIAREPLITIAPSLSRIFSMQMLTPFLERNYTINVVQEVADMHCLLGLIGAGMGLSLVPASLQSIRISHVTYRPIIEQMPTSTFQIAWRPDSNSHIVAAFVEAARVAVEQNSAPVGIAPLS